MVLTEEQKKINRSICKKKYYDNNKEKICEQTKQYRLNNIDKIREWQNHYDLDNHKRKTIKRWKRRGIIDDDWDSLYDCFIKETNCMICDKLYNTDKGYDLRCLEHDHNLFDQPNIRYICCHYCNLHIVK